MNKYKVVTSMFIFIITSIMIKTLISNKGKFRDALVSDNLIKGVEDIYNKDLGFAGKFIHCWSITQWILGTELLDDAESRYLIKDSTGNLYFPYFENNEGSVYDLAEKTISYSNLVESRGSNFIYIQAPNKVIENYSSDTVFAFNDANKSADKFLNYLEEKNVNTLDLRKKLPNSGLDLQDLFYKSDHHWKTKTAFWGFQEIFKYLKNNYNLDLNDLYISLDNYNTKLYENCFLGSLGRRVYTPLSTIDDYLLIYPKFDTDYEVINGAQNTTIATGDFLNSIVINKILDNPDIKTNRYATYFEWDYGNLIIKNNTCDNNIKILMIKDSFALPVAAYLSTCVKEIHMVDLRDNEAVNLTEYVQNYDFDIVMMLFNPETFNSTMFNFEKK